jgi:hypothetical protein
MSNPLRILNETRIDLEGARPYFGTPEEPASTITVRRAIRIGSRTPDGGRTYLEHLKTGLKIFTSVEAIERYFAAINGISLDGDVTDEGPWRLTKARQRELERVDAELASIGI